MEAKNVSWHFFNCIFHHQLNAIRLLAVEFATLTLDPSTKTPKAKIYRPGEIDALLRKHDLAKKDDDEMAS